MALSDVKVRSAKPEVKAYKLTDGDGMILLVHPNGSKSCSFIAASLSHFGKDKKHEWESRTDFCRRSRSA